MAANRVLVTAGWTIKREGRLMTGSVRPFTFVMPAANADKNIATDKSTGDFAPATANYVDQIAVVDLSSTNGMEVEDVFVTGDQIPVVFPTNGTQLNVFANAGEYTIGGFVAIGANGMLSPGTDAATAIGISRENVTIASPEPGALPGKVKMEVLK